MDYNYLKIKDYDFRLETNTGYSDQYMLSFNERQHIKVSEKAKKILDCFNGKRSLEQVQVELNNQGIEFESDDIIKFVDEILVANSILEGMAYDTRSKGKSYMWFHLPIIESDKLSGLFNLLKVLFNKYISFFVIFIILMCSIFSIYNVAVMDTMYKRTNSLLLIILMYLSLLLHEFGHISAAYSYGIKVGHLGIGLYLFNPVLYVDMTNIWRLEYKKRVVVDVGGIFFQLITIIPITIIAMVEHNFFLYMINVTIIVMTMVNLVPFIKLDGYWVLCDYLEIDNIASNAFGIVFNNIKKIFSKNVDIYQDKPRNKIYIAFAFIYTISTFLVSLLGLKLALTAILNFDVINAGFIDIFKGIRNGNFGMAFSTLNEIFAYILPLIFLGYIIIKMLFNVIKGLLWGKKE